MNESYSKNPPELQEVINIFYQSVLEAETEEESLEILRAGINEGPLNTAHKAVAQALLVIINYTKQYPSVRELAIKHLSSLNFSEAEMAPHRLAIQQTLANEIYTANLVKPPVKS